MKISGKSILSSSRSSSTKLPGKAVICTVVWDLRVASNWLRLSHILREKGGSGGLLGIDSGGCLLAVSRGNDIALGPHSWGSICDVASTRGRVMNALVFLLHLFVVAADDNDEVGK